MNEPAQPAPASPVARCGGSPGKPSWAPMRDPTNDPLVRCTGCPDCKPATDTRCLTCGHDKSVHGPVSGVCAKCREVHMNDTFPKPNAEHPFVPTPSTDASCGRDFMTSGGWGAECELPLDHDGPHMTQQDAPSTTDANFARLAQQAREVGAILQVDNPQDSPLLDAPALSTTDAVEAARARVGGGIGLNTNRHGVPVMEWPNRDEELDAHEAAIVAQERESLFALWHEVRASDIARIEALEAYAVHRTGCNVYFVGLAHAQAGDCTCGLDAALDKEVQP